MSSLPPCEKQVLHGSTEGHRFESFAMDFFTINKEKTNGQSIKRVERGAEQEESPPLMTFAPVERADLFSMKLVLLQNSVTSS